MSPSNKTPPFNARASALETIDLEYRGLDTLRAAMEGELGAKFAEACARIAAAKGRVIVTGMGKSGHVGRKIASTLASTGTPAHFVHPGEASHGDLGMIQPEDVILALSWSGETAELADIVGYASRFGVLIVAVTSNPDSALGRAADVILVLPKASEACPNGLAPTTSTTMQIVLGDALAVALLAARGFTAQDFRLFHPGGRLGAQLKRVSDIMHVGERLPVIGTGALMSDALIEMSAKGFGTIIVTSSDGRLAGVITDGDLRRHMAPDLMRQKVDSVMTRMPTVIGPDDLVADALELIEKKKRGALIVVQNERPIGLVHVLDLLQAGAA
jgi:arabinose-5-phosphate isomerase